MSHDLDSVLLCTTTAFDAEGVPVSVQQGSRAKLLEPLGEQRMVQVELETGERLGVAAVAVLPLPNEYSLGVLEACGSDYMLIVSSLLQLEPVEAIRTFHYLCVQDANLATPISRVLRAMRASTLEYLQREARRLPDLPPRKGASDGAGSL